MADSDLKGILGYHPVSKEQARELIHPHLGVDGYYLLRPSSDTHGGVLCTICVTNKSKLLNYRLVSSTHNGLFYIHNHTTFSSIQKLIEHYRAMPINAEVGTKLLYPVGVQLPPSGNDECYVVMERQGAVDPTTSADSENSGSVESGGVRGGNVKGGNVKGGGVRDGNVKGGRGVRVGGVRDGNVRDGGMRDGNVKKDGGVRDGGVRYGNVSDVGMRDGGVRDGGVRDVNMKKDGGVRGAGVRDVNMKKDGGVRRESAPVGRGVRDDVRRESVPVGRGVRDDVRRESAPVGRGVRDDVRRESVQEGKSEVMRGDSIPDEMDNIPGLHPFLPKADIKNVMQRYLTMDGSYLLRPSTSSEGQLTLAVSHKGKVLNFKISCSNSQYFIASKKRFDTVQELLQAYARTPIRSKQQSEKIYVLFPIPVDKSLEKKYKMVAKEKTRKAPIAPEPLPEPWVEYYNDQYHKPYYYNPQTKISLWERPTQPSIRSLTLPARPKASPKLPRKPKPQEKPLPTIPNGHDVPRHPAKEEQLSPPVSSRRWDQPLPLPPGEDLRRPAVPHRNTPDRSTPDRSTPERTLSEKRGLPPLPPKEEPILTRSLPPLPPKENSLPLRQPAAPQLPTKGPPSRPPPKEERSLPPLPPKDDRPLPPLPPKEPDVLKTPSPPPPNPPSERRREKRKQVVEYEDTVLQQDTKTNVPVPTPPSLPSKGPSLPPLPEKNHLPPPPPIINIPAPPPPPPTLPPPPSPNISLLSGGANARHQLTPTPDSSPGTGRPFSSNDLLQAKTLLRKADDSPDVRRHTMSNNTGGDLADVFNRAIDTRMMSIRKAAAPDSDDESDMEFEDIDEEWDD